MNDSVDVKRHVYLQTIAKLKVHAESVALDPTVWGRRV